MIRVLLVDDHTVFVETLSVALGTRKDMTIVGVTTTASEGLEAIATLQPDVALLDVGLPDFNGIELARKLRTASPSTRVVMLTGITDPSLFPQAMAAGACGYLIKEASLEEVADAVRRAHAGQVVVPERSMGRLLETTPPQKGTGSDLTDRELEVLALLGSGSDAKTIARSLGITWHTTRSYVKSILLKLDAHSQLEAVAKATRLGIFNTERP